MSENIKTPFQPMEWVKALSVTILVAVFSYKVFETPITLTVDFPTLLSLLLAMFSVGLAALFYFKATETSNSFYDNTHKFTRDIAQLLAKMESGFGERLRHLDEGYSSMRDHFQKGGAGSGLVSGVEETKKRIEEEQQDIRKSLEERSQIVSELLEKSQLQDEERQEISRKLMEKEKEVQDAQNELMKMNRRLAMERMQRRRESNRGRHNFDRYTASHVINELGTDEILNGSMRSITRMFAGISRDLPDAYISDLTEAGYFEEELTADGVRYLKHLAANGL